MKHETADVHFSYAVLDTRISLLANAGKAAGELKLRKMANGPFGMEGQELLLLFAKMFHPFGCN